MRNDLASYWKITGACLAAAILLALLALGGAVWMAPRSNIVLWSTLRALAAALAALLLLGGICGLLVIVRCRRLDGGRGDLFLAFNASRSEPGLGESRRPPLRWLRRLLGAPSLLVGDRVRVRPWRDIAATLGADDSLEGLPFMREMMRYCEQTATVFRCVDKVYDYGGRKNLRAIEGVVTLRGLRCDGSSHGGCEAGCYLLWKTAWLERCDESVAEATRGGDPQLRSVTDSRHGDEAVYRCQYTQLVAASQPLNPSDPRHDLRPLVAGNVTLAAFGIAMATRFFNVLQRLHRGIGFPSLPRHDGALRDYSDPAIAPGDLVRVRSAAQIAGTLGPRGKHRGLWFDRDMMKHCGRCVRVSSRATRIIDDATGRMIRLKWPCFVLQGIDGTGEFLRLAAQHDLVFWRDSWVERISAAPESGAADRTG